MPACSLCDVHSTLRLHKPAVLLIILGDPRRDYIYCAQCLTTSRRLILLATAKYTMDVDFFSSPTCFVNATSSRILPSHDTPPDDLGTYTMLWMTIHLLWYLPQ